MHRIILMLALSCASLNAQWLFDPIRNVIGGGLSAIGGAITPNKAHWEPEFEMQAKIVPPYKQDGTPNDGSYFTLIRKREFATDATAHWIAKEFGGQAVLGPYAGSDMNVMRLNPPRKQWSVAIDGVLIPAGHVAWWYTLRPAASREDDTEAGYWPWFTQDDTRMNGAKSLAKMFVTNSVKYGVSKAWELMREYELAHVDIDITCYGTSAECADSTETVGQPRKIAHGPTLPPDPWFPIQKAA